MSSHAPSLLSATIAITLSISTLAACGSSESNAGSGGAGASGGAAGAGATGGSGAVGGLAGAGGSAGAPSAVSCKLVSLADVACANPPCADYREGTVSCDGAGWVTSVAATPNDEARLMFVSNWQVFSQHLVSFEGQGSVVDAPVQATITLMAVDGAGHSHIVGSEVPDLGIAHFFEQGAGYASEAISPDSAKFYQIDGMGLAASGDLWVLYDASASPLVLAHRPPSGAISYQTIAPSLFGGAALALDPSGAPHTAAFVPRTSGQGRDLVVDATPVFYEATNVDNGTGVRVAVGASATVAAADLDDALHLFVGSVEAVVPETARPVWDCPMPASCSGSCAQKSNGLPVAAHALVRSDDGRIWSLRVNQVVDRVQSFEQHCYEAGCQCTPTVTTESSHAEIVVDRLDGANVVEVGRFDAGPIEASSLAADAHGGDLHVAVAGAPLAGQPPAVIRYFALHTSAF